MTKKNGRNNLGRLTSTKWDNLVPDNNPVVLSQVVDGKSTTNVLSKRDGDKVLTLATM